MRPRFILVSALLAATSSALLAAPVEAASLQQVSGWTGGTTFPSDVSMYAYVPDKVATNPPILVLAHYCGGKAADVFSQASGGGIVKAADQYGFIMVVPSSGRCWDVTSAKAQTRDGGGDTHAIKQMVKFALDKYKANPDRVYSTGDSSGAMMTELLMAVYPDIFKAGSAFAGVPAGCGNEFDGSGLCGRSAQTAQQWGDRVRAMYPGYAGHRPRLQLFHGDADATITYKNLAEAIKEWTNVLSLATDPSSTDTGLTLGSHQAERRRWKNSCGYVVLDAFTSLKGDHGPSDTLFVSTYVIPFLGLDKTGAVDPEIEQCGSGGTGGTSGSDGGIGSGGNTGSGGRSGSGGNTGRGGNTGNGGNTGSSGSSANGGSSGGRSGGSAGNSNSGGSVGPGGSTASGGSSSGGSTTQGSGGSRDSGSTSDSGGQSATSSSSVAGGSGTGVPGGTTSTGKTNPGSGGSASTGGSDPGGCSCALGGASQRIGVQPTVALGLVLWAFMRRRRRAG
jgi:poly(hydroxyalkanoate) depolymerase family esterase